MIDATSAAAGSVPNVGAQSPSSRLAQNASAAAASRGSAEAAPRTSCREVYLAEPKAIGPDEKVCDIAYPLG
jgi:hypothetical protein